MSPCHFNRIKIGISSLIVRCARACVCGGVLSFAQKSMVLFITGARNFALKEIA